MTNLDKQNIAIVMKTRLLNLARQTGRPFEEILQYFAMERFLYRLCKSSHCNHFILKGALLFYVWELQDARATRDIDMLAKTKNSPENIANLVREICEIEIDCSDGIVFETDTLRTEVMQNQREYEGIRVHFQARLEKSMSHMQIDFGFGDAVTPAPERISYPTLLDLSAPNLHGYPVETVIAEKLHTMFEKEMFNSRVKDYYDVWVLLRWGHFDAKILEEALKRTFKQRGGTWDKKALLNVVEHYGASGDRQKDWERYLRKGKYETAPHDLVHVCTYIVQILLENRKEPSYSASIGLLLGQGKYRGRNLLQIVERLIQSGADVNDNSNNDHRPLNIAVSKGLREVANLLLNAGADSSKRDKSGLNAFEWALKRGSYKLAYEMVKRGHPYMPRHPHQHLKVPFENLHEFDLRYF